MYFAQGGAYTAQSEYATEGDSRSIKDYVAYTEESVSRSLAGFMDALFCSGGGDGQLDTIVTVGANYLVVNNANFVPIRSGYRHLDSPPMAHLWPR